MRSIFVFVCVLFTVAASAQKIAKADVAWLQRFEDDSLKPASRQMIFDTVPGRRFAADSAFVKRFVRALKTNNSFYYPFDSVTTVSILYPPDSTFRIFTWELQRDEGYYRQHGAIQMKTADGSLKLFPLLDQSDFSSSPESDVRSAQNWVGAIYYQLITKEFKGKKYYTLFGLDDNDLFTTRKWLDVLTFNAEGKPVFGANVFDYKDDGIKPPQPVSRFLLEYKKDAKARLVYDPDLGMIVFDHLASETKEPAKKFTLIPDGTYEGFAWKNGKWVHIDDVFANMPGNNKVPTPQPVYDADGKPINN